jgi:hypothetical protein
MYEVKSSGRDGIRYAIYRDSELRSMANTPDARSASAA